MADLRETLVAYGADMKGAMGRFLNDTELYQSCLDSFMQDSSFDQLKAALSAKDYEAAYNAAHSLKGLSGNMGLTPLYEAVCTVVELLRAHTYENVDAKFDDVMAEHARLAKILNS